MRTSSGAEDRDRPTDPASGTRPGESDDADSLPPEDDSPTFQPPLVAGDMGRLGPYRVLKPIGRGGMGIVYAAIDTRLNRQIALKVMRPRVALNPGARQRFLREARAAAQITHDHVVTIHEADDRDGIPYFAMQFLRGYSLDEYLARKGNLSLSQTLRIVRETASGLEAAHQLGLIHRDIKPANLWLEAPNGRVRILDFGLAKPVDAGVELTKSGVIVGTPAYLSLEQANNEALDARTDLYSLGCVLYRLLTGQLPFPGTSTMAILLALGSREPVPVRELNPQVPERLAELVHQLLAKKKEHRPGTAAEVVRRLREFEDELETPTALAVAPSQLPRIEFTPLQVSAFVDENPFANIEVDGGDTEDSSGPRVKPGRSRVLLTLALGSLAILIVAGGSWLIYQRSGMRVEKENPGTPAPPVAGTTNRPSALTTAQDPKIAKDPERLAAEYAIAQGGFVRVEGVDADISRLQDLPRGNLTLRVVDLSSRPVTDEGLTCFLPCKSLISLALSETRLTDRGLACFKNCRELQSLWLLNCRGVSNLGLSYCKEMKDLRELYLDGTGVTDAGLSNFRECHSLEVLGLLETNISDDGLAHFQNCRGVKALRLSSTQVTDKGLGYFKASAAPLTSLYLGGTKVTDDGILALPAMPLLGHVSLGPSRVTDRGLARFRESRSITMLDLSQTAVTNEGLAVFREIRTITYLGLSQTDISDQGLAVFRNCTNLENIFLSQTSISDDGLAFFQGCPQLRIVDLSGTRISDQGLVHLRGRRNLKDLRLSGIPLTDVGLAMLREFPKLENLVVRGKGLSATAIGDFRKTVPGCTLTIE